MPAFNDAVLYLLIVDDSDFAVHVFTSAEHARRALDEVLADEAAFVGLPTVAATADERDGPSLNWP